ncbi:hypothetical protein I302_105575 [Kwoniella bestiolae CBS 10118]|uniref:Zn(2)-C6 fungal-type domain-containing protein n=1 Tax=Kwoniella bestiolae CBS 10118 TaxID=1296100 RepID=A0A1B9G1I2_9TREE|nr:hypothetical protein I302_04694 [Kwoniella bestiolae CBS 10118]OCF24884.1 hypothetical protein I302_04694 [Kwoniella bestiolae CBS 10118]
MSVSNTSHRSKNTSRACTRCRKRKIRCNGDTPQCATCVNVGEMCTYPTLVDRRLTDQTAVRKIEQLTARVQELEMIIDGGQLFPPGTDDETVMMGDTKPFETGRLVLSSTGSLHLHPSATFYYPAYLTAEWQHPMDTLIARPTPLPGYLASYLPFPMSMEHHRILVDLAFECSICFATSPFKDKFIAAMDQDPDRWGPYFSPLLHLCVLGVGWRYCRDQTLISMYYPNVPREQRGKDYMDKAKILVLNGHTPHLSTITALFIMAIYYCGDFQNPLSGLCFVRLHKRCDAQFEEIGQRPDSDLDIARRDVWGYTLNISAIWATFYAQPTLPLLSISDQRPPFVYGSDLDEVERRLSLMGKHHFQLSCYGLKALEANHLVRLPIEMRVQRMREAAGNLLKWRENLPEEIAWPPTPIGSPMHPNTIVTHGIHATAAQDIVDQSRYLAEKHGVCKAPLTWNQVAHVCGTMLVLQTSGLPGVTPGAKQTALSSLRMLQNMLDEFGEIWDAARKTASSLRQLQAECDPVQPAVDMFNNASNLTYSNDFAFYS